MLSRIGDARKSKVHDLYGNKNKDIKTRQVVKKHQKRQALNEKQEENNGKRYTRLYERF